ncbi:MAG TPA: thiamine-phosphate kinase [Deltaproteobacteria bacterium]|nr:MAG: thiamine-phosphate kinase [Deltaproteobacteria bacterium GWC2_65_14]HBO70771.1 thiamine-phosphate kinase [Deltaproteobacteria bacterium]
MKRERPLRGLLRDLGESGFIEHVRRRFGGPVRPGELGIGDDAAVLPARGGKLVLTADMLLEGVHFDLRYFRPEEVGWRALMANLSDLAAMGASPDCYLVSVAAPPDTPLALLSGIFGGMAKAARPSGTRLMGGDTCRGERLALSLALVGRIRRGREIRRNGARPGDFLYLTGDPGWSFLGLRLLSRGRPKAPRGWRRQAMRSHLTPVARLQEGIAAARSGAVSAMIDVSDGVLPDLRRMLGESGGGALLDERAFRLSKRFREAASSLGEDPVSAFLAGGEDYELLMAVRSGRFAAFRRAARSFPARVFPIGVVTGRPGIRVLRADGSWMEDADLPVGFSHFPAPPSPGTGSRKGGREGQSRR